MMYIFCFPYPDSQRLTNVVNALGLMTKLKWKLSAHKTDTERQNQMLMKEMEGQGFYEKLDFMTGIKAHFMRNLHHFKTGQSINGRLIQLGQLTFVSGTRLFLTLS